MAIPGGRSDTGLIDAISGLGDPWVVAMNQNDLKRQLEGLPRGPGGQVDYSAAALQLMGRHPLAAQQLTRMAEQRSAAGHRAATLQLHRDQLKQQADIANKPQYRQDDEGDWVAFRPDGSAIYVTGPNTGKQSSERTTAQPQQQPQPSAPGARSPGAPAALSPSVLPDIETLGNEPTTRTPSSADVAELQRDPSPDNVSKFDAYFGPGTSQKVLGSGRRSEAPAAMPSLSDGAPTQMPTQMADAGQGVGASGGGLAETMAQSAQSIDPNDLPELEPNVRPQQSVGAKGRKAVEQASQIDANKKQNTLMEKQVESALLVKDYIPSVNRAVGMWKELTSRGSKLASDFPLVNTGPGAAVLRGARGLANAAGVGGAMPDIVANQQFAQPFREAMAHLELLRSQAIKGQGQITESERAILRRSLPTLDTSNPAETEKQLRELADVLTTIYRRGALASRALQQREGGPR